MTKPVETHITLSPERATRLKTVAHAEGVSEEELIGRLVDVFLAGVGAEEGLLRREDYWLSLHAMREDWEAMPEDWASV